MAFKVHRIVLRRRFYTNEQTNWRGTKEKGTFHISSPSICSSFNIFHKHGTLVYIKEVKVHKMYERVT